MPTATALKAARREDVQERLLRAMASAFRPGALSGEQAQIADRQMVRVERLFGFQPHSFLRDPSFAISSISPAASFEPEAWEAHAGLDYACVMRPGEGTETASISVHTDCPDDRDTLLAQISLLPQLLAALTRAECFMAGFEDDPGQEGVDEQLCAVRALLAKAGRA